MARLLVLALPAMAYGCSERPAASASSHAPCEVPVPVERPESELVIVRGMDAPCTIEFREVVTLRGDPEGELPRLPVSLGPGGGWVTGTYDPGEIAFWSASGELERIVGKGPGDGPGEFGAVTDLVVDTASRKMYVFSGATYVEVYSLAGQYLQRLTVPAGIAQSGVLLSDGTLVTTTTPPTSEPSLVLLRADTVVRVGPPQRGPMFPPVVKAAPDGIWSFERPWYEVAHHVMPDGSVDFRIRREADPFPTPTEKDVLTAATPILRSFSFDSQHGLAFAVLAQVKDPNAPRMPAPRPKTPEEATELGRRYMDGVVEAFTLDGRLVASTRFDLVAPLPLRSNNPAHLWSYVEDDDTKSIRILTPVLVRR